MLEVAGDQAFPWVQQVSIFLPNRVGSLERVIQQLDEAQVAVCGLTILDAHDHAVVRMVVDRPEKAAEALRQHGRTPVSTRLLGVAVPADASAMSQILGRLLRAEINVHYAYALLVRHGDDAVVVVHADAPEVAVSTLRAGGFQLVDQRDLVSDPD